MVAVGGFLLLAARLCSYLLVDGLLDDEPAIGCR